MRCLALYLVAGVVFFLPSGVGAASLDAPFFLQLGTSSDSFEPTAISADGSTVIGGGRKWNLAAGFEVIASSASWPAPGAAYIRASDGRFYGFLADQSVQEVLIPHNISDPIVGISADGSVLVHQSAMGPLPGAGPVAAGDNTPIPPYGVARGVSADGSVIFGRSNYLPQLAAEGNMTATRRQTAGGTPIALGPPVNSTNTGLSHGNAVASTPDGSVIIGSAGVCLGLNGCSNQPFRWSESTGMVALGGPDAAYQYLSVSADGLTILGTGLAGGGVSGAHTSFLWSEETGMLGTRGLLSLAGMPDEWTDVMATLLSADGTTLAGTGIGPDGGFGSWIAHAPEGWFLLTPEPDTAFLILVGLLGLASDPGRRFKP